MSPLLLRAFINERLTAVVEEIFQVFEGTIAKYEEEASNSKHEIERLRGLLLELENQRADTSQSPSIKDETPHKRHHCEQKSVLIHSQVEPELPHIKQEDPELWATEQQEEDLAEEGADVFDPQQTSEQEDTKPPVQRSIQTCEPEEEFQVMQEVKNDLFHSSFPSTLPSHNEATASFASEQKQGQTPSVLSRELRDPSLMTFTGTDHRCHLCSGIFSSIHRLVNHALRIHLKDSCIVCAVCGKTLEGTGNLQLHLKSHENPKSCHICGKQYKSTTSLTEHMASHAGLKLHHCHVCGKECSRKGDLKIHMRIHTGEKPFCCSVCGKSFTHSGHLRKHTRSHTGERPYRCDVCGRGFLQSAHLKYHLGTHAHKW
uniref:C2H2-type domain-containing protein n=2 Tax=Nothobranchius pienaari TaxID=704102 RepID=A0A1A8MLE9_9TELE